jgi:hypothetical protein
MKNQISEETEREINNNHKSVRVVLLPNSMSEYDKSGWHNSFIARYKAVTRRGNRDNPVYDYGFIYDFSNALIPSSRRSL